MKFVIDGRITGYNQYIDKCRRNPYQANKTKQSIQEIIQWDIKAQRVGKPTSYPVEVYINWYEPNDKRDVDNIQSGQKFILDALVNVGILENDSRKYVSQIHHMVYTDRDKPRIEVEIREV